MRVEVLSDHGHHQLQQTEQELQTAEANMAALSDAYRHTWNELDSARRAKPLWKRVFRVASAAERDVWARERGIRQQLRHAEVGSTQIHQRAQQQAAGIQGEDVLQLALASALSDEWMMLRGYHNRRGEADHVLVGPRGVWAVEVKYRRVRLTVDGDHCWYEKLDRYGNVVETGWALDGRGRSWSQQVNDVAGDLARWLGRHQYDVGVCTAVMLTHAGAVLGPCENLTVHLIGTDPQRLLEAIAESPPSLDTEACEGIVRLIRRDHRFHAAKRAGK